MLEDKYEKKWSSKVVKLTLSRNMSKQKQSENAGKGTQQNEWKET